MRVFIPTTGDMLRLESPWQFTVFSEHRNHEFIKAASIKNQKGGNAQSWETVEIGTTVIERSSELVVDRVYIRQGMNDFDSVTFVVASCNDRPKLVGQRFWAKLADVNLIEAELVARNQPTGIAAQAAFKARLKRADPKEAERLDKQAANKLDLKASNDVIDEMQRSIPYAVVSEVLDRMYGALTRQPYYRSLNGLSCRPKVSESKSIDGCRVRRYAFVSWYSLSSVDFAEVTTKDGVVLNKRYLSTDEMITRVRKAS